MGKLLLKAVLFILPGIACFLSPLRVDAQYKITGQLKNYDSLWIHEISLCALSSLSQLNFASSDIVINKDTLDKEGNFTITGNNLPDDDRIYRLDLTNHANAAMVQRGVNSNSIFLILNNHSTVKITCSNFSRYPFNYAIDGAAENSALQKFEIYQGSLDELFMDPNSKEGTGKEYATNKFNADIRNYCDTCKYPLVALIGIYGITDFEKDYTEHPEFYKRFLTRIQGLSEPTSIYVTEFEKKLNMLDYQNHAPDSTTEYFTRALVYVEALIILFLLSFAWYLKNKIKRVKGSVNNEESPDRSKLLETLSRREKEILLLLIEDIQNKEIANRLNLEVSTIKSHIGNIYQKLSISNRNEVKAFEPYLKENNE